METGFDYPILRTEQHIKKVIEIVGSFSNVVGDLSRRLKLLFDTGITYAVLGCM